MLGAMAGSAGLDDEALELLKGRRIRIIWHVEQNQAGRNAVCAWVEKLKAIGCDGDALNVSILHQDAKDLNDLTRLLSPEQQEAFATDLLP
jgi:hypothetical protein